MWRTGADDNETVATAIDFMNNTRIFLAHTVSPGSSGGSPTAGCGVDYEGGERCGCSFSACPRSVG